ncbi:Arc family DNA-binding protein [Bradyrhizobium sp. sBnM-33]|uniref:Arc family DNA-binding protein n=1 Tax=Bradyrhizobium sp. sBnM-33 TaxID=2831780 RepID=UPI001BCC728E
MDSKIEFERQLVRLPRDAKDFIKREAERNCGSQNSEIVRSIRARMDGEKRDRAAG